MRGGGEGSRTPVRKHFLRNFSGRRRFFAFPHHDASRHASWFGSFICHAGGKAYPGHVHHSGHAQAQLVVLLGWTAAIKQRREQFYCCSLIYKVPVLRMSGTSARYSCPHVPVETSTPPNDRLFEWRTKGKGTLTSRCRHSKSEGLQLAAAHGPCGPHVCKLRRIFSPAKPVKK